MQNILSVDIASEPACAVVLGVEDKTVRLLSKYYASLNDPVSQPDLSNPGHMPLDQDDQPSPEAGPSLRPLLDQVKTPWHSAALLIPPHDCLSMNLTLPFGDKRSLEKVIDLEVQDFVPFEVEDFLVQYHPLHTLPDGRHDIHVNLLPRAYLQSILKLCKHSQFDPMIISTAAGVIGGAYYLAPDFFEANSALLFVQGKWCHLCIRMDGKVIANRVISFSALNDRHARHALITEIKLALYANEERCGATLSGIYLCGAGLPLEELQQNLGRELTPIKAEQFVRGAEDNLAAAALAGVFLRDLEPPPLLTNFRAREFAYYPQIKELFRGVKMLGPYLAGLALLAALYLTASYLFKEHRLIRMENALATEIRAQLPELQSGEVSLSTVNEKNKRLDDELRDLGSPSQFTPLDAFAAISEDLSRAAKEIPELSVTSLHISSNRITTELDTPDYKDGERIEKMLKSKRKNNIYCKVEAEDLGRSGLTNKRFRFKIRLCEQ
ncbi:MAG: hypothetical protein GX589_11345 [Deltaproteobacteria bacterium]|nr:hypothetical protein [Deltaproteobacteria bacterium]